MKKQLNLNTAWCKGCGVCAAFCPKKVLKLVHGKITVAAEGCIACCMCESLCPDYAIWLAETEVENVG